TDYTVRVTALSDLGEEVTGVRLVPLAVGQIQTVNLRGFQTASLAVVRAAAALKQAFEEDHADLIEAAIFKYSGAVADVNNLYKRALDPPDPDFTSVVPLPPPEPVGAATAGSWSALLQQALRADRRLAQINDAIRVTEDRWLGASIAGDSLWAANQLAA